jgi:RNA polymerase sigma-70 factor, ECF subfamily
MAASESPQVLVKDLDDAVVDELLKRTAAGDQAAFNALYDRSAGRLFAVCLRVARHRRLAEELLREVYVRIWEKARDFDPRRGRALAWMTALARNHAIDVIRLKIREPRPPDEVTLEAAEPTALGAMEARVEFDAIGRCLRELAYGERHALVLAYRDGLSYDQLAVLLGVSVETVKEWVNRGLAKLRDCMDKAP